LLQQNPNLSQLTSVSSTKSGIPADQQWYCLVSGHEVGPMSIETLVQMVLQGRVFPGDVIRLGTSGEWFPASSVEGLFPKVTPGAPPIASSEAPAPLEESASDKLNNIRNIPESDRVIQGIERLYKASEDAAKELEEKAQKEGTKAEKKVVGSSTSPSASRQAADSIIKNYSQFAITSAERKKAEELANRMTLSEKIAQNKVNLIIGLVVGVAAIALVIYVNAVLSP
ncbi:MAG: DUF4339 domain-containing protein, partial [Planctomycetaceae bacterium]|nr:DUF4339 domain-containing protein [Planctomycetaceae bacterium]